MIRHRIADALLQAVRILEILAVPHYVSLVTGANVDQHLLIHEVQTKQRRVLLSDAAKRCGCLC